VHKLAKKWLGSARLLTDKANHWLTRISGLLRRSFVFSDELALVIITPWHNSMQLLKIRSSG